jgi:hypothetical protein
MLSVEGNDAAATMTDHSGPWPSSLFLSSLGQSHARLGRPLGGAYRDCILAPHLFPVSLKSSKLLIRRIGYDSIARQMLLPSIC